MCYDTEKTQAPGVGYGIAGCDTLNQTETNQAQTKALSSFRDRLESRRNRLTRQLVEVEEALKLIYTNPDAEKIHDILMRTGVI